MPATKSRRQPAPLTPDCYRVVLTKKDGTEYRSGVVVPEALDAYLSAINDYTHLSGTTARAIPCRLVEMPEREVTKAQVILQPDGEVVHEAPLDECQIIADEFNRLCETDPTGDTAVVVVVGKDGA